MATSYSSPLPPYSETVLPKTFGITTPFAILATLFYAARIYTRIRLAIRLRWDDHFMSFAIASYDQSLGCGIRLTLLGMCASNMDNSARLCGIDRRATHTISLAREDIVQSAFYVCDVAAFYLDHHLRQNIGRIDASSTETG